MTDRDLLIAFQQSRSHDFFARIVHRHANLVYAHARRLAKNQQLAEDIAQEVFFTLFREAAKINPQVPLVGWLFITTRHRSLEALRAAARRHTHERKAAMSHEASHEPDPTWNLIAEDVDDAVAELTPDERHAILLRYFAGKTHHEIATELSISDEAAKKRVQRAVESLRQSLTTRGTAIPATALAAALSAHAAAEAAPATLAATITTAASAPTTTAIATAKGVALLMTLTKTQITAAVVAIIALIAVPVGLLTLTPSPPPPATAPVAAALPTDSTEPPTAAADPFGKYIPDPDQALIRVTGVPDDIRFKILRASAAPRDGLPDAVGLGPVIYSFENEKRRWVDFTVREPAYLAEELLEFTTHIPPQDVEGEALRYTPIPGDFVFQPNLPVERYLRAIENIYRKDLGRTIKLELRDVPRPVIVLRGTWNYTPIAGTTAADMLKYPVVQFYNVTPAHDPLSGNGAIANSVAELAAPLAKWIKRTVVVDAASMDVPVRWYNVYTEKLVDFRGDTKQVLNHVAEQSGLTWAEEVRTVRRLIVTEEPTTFPAPYLLAHNESLKHIAEPPAEARTLLLERILSSSLTGDKTQMGDNIHADFVTMFRHIREGKPPFSLTFRENNGQLQGWAWKIDGPYLLADVLEHCLGAFPQEVEGEPGNVIAAGDWICDESSPIEDRRAALEEILLNELHQPLKLVYRDVPRDVIVLSGTWKYSPVELTRVIGGNTPSLELYESTISPYPASKGSGNSRRFEQELGKYLHEQVVVDAKEFPASLAWNFSREPTSQNPAAILDHLKAQAGLTWSKETRTVRRLFIESK